MADIPTEVLMGLIGLVGASISMVVGSIVWALKSSHAQNDKLLTQNEAMRLTLENHLTASTVALVSLNGTISKNVEITNAFFNKWEERWEIGRKEGSEMWKE